jgi:hypothetical protein
MNIKEVKIMMHLHIHNMEELTTKEEIADFINQMIYEDPEFFAQLDKDNIVDVREFEVNPTENRETD